MNEGLDRRLNNIKLSGKDEILKEYILGNLSRAAFFSGAQLAEVCNVSTSAVTRFAQKLGYSGFPELKEELEKNFRTNITPYEMLNEYLVKDKEESIFESSIKQDLNNILTMKNNIDKDKFKVFIDKILSAESIFTAAISGSESFVFLFDFYLKLLGLNHIALRDIGLSKKFEAHFTSKNDIFIAVSYQRIYKEVRDAVLLAKKRGLYTVAITDSTLNPLSAISEYTILTPSSGASFGYTHSASIVLLNLIVNSVAVRNPENSLQSLESLKWLWDNGSLFCS